MTTYTYKANIVRFSGSVKPPAPTRWEATCQASGLHEARQIIASMNGVSIAEVNKIWRV